MEEEKNREEANFENNIIKVASFIIFMIVLTYFFEGINAGNGMTLIALLILAAFIALILFIKSMFAFGSFIDFIRRH